jgi:hypothetical protein
MEVCKEEQNHKQSFIEREETPPEPKNLLGRVENRPHHRRNNERTQIRAAK